VVWSSMPRGPPKLSESLDTVPETCRMTLTGMNVFAVSSTSIKAPRSVPRSLGAICTSHLDLVCGQTSYEMSQTRLGGDSDFNLPKTPHVREFIKPLPASTRQDLVKRFCAPGSKKIAMQECQQHSLSGTGLSWLHAGEV